MHMPAKPINLEAVTPPPQLKGVAGATRSSGVSLIVTAVLSKYSWALAKTTSWTFARRRRLSCPVNYIRLPFPHARLLPSWGVCSTVGANSVLYGTSRPRTNAFRSYVNLPGVCTDRWLVAYSAVLMYSNWVVRNECWEA